MRELEHAVKHAVIQAHGAEITVADLSLAADAEFRPGAGTARGGTLADLEQDRILTTLKRCGGDRGEAARILGINRTTLWRKLRQYERRGEEKQG